ncbi:hypothetical protein FFF34_006725 [Inquilinus sp. KBS0705]|nr:hypothetical protein FFF34_006725 [Inquilinus sp. KBS0705]
MKVRITGNKIRLRLKEPEVQRLFKDEPIEERLVFGQGTDQQLVFKLQIGGLNQLSISYQPGAMIISMPKMFSETLAITDKVGYEDKIDTENTMHIHLLIEKDFECLDAPEEANEGSYPNPKQIC